ncbi:MAG: S41 family peptidase [Flavobacteriales bacterium]
MKNYLLIALLFVFLTSCNAQQQIKNEVLEGKWYLDFQHNDIGLARTFMHFETNGNSFEAYTRKNADRDILGGWTSMLGRTFTKSFKNGSLLRVVNGTHKTENDTLKLSGVLTSAMGNYHFKGYVKGNDLCVTLTNGIGQQRGIITGTKKQVQQPLENYPDLFKASVQLTENNIFNKDLLQTKKWKTFVKDMGKVSSKVQDDLEMVFAFFYYAGKLPISHFALMKIPEQEKDTSMHESNKYVFLEEKSPQTVYIKITSFSGTASEMDSIFEIINHKDYKNLIVDLRNNSGGSVAAGMAFTTSVVDSTFYGGVFLTQKWFIQHKQPPTVESYPTFPHFTEANFDLIIEGIHNTDVLCLKIIPKPTVYRGNIYILTNSKTASTCEPIVYGLKQQKRATIIGEKTAGAMLNGELFELDKGFKMVIPTADYYASDGYRIDQNGVKPNIETKQEEALDYVMKNLIK